MEFCIGKMSNSKENEKGNTPEGSNKSIDNLIENITGLVDTYIEMAQLEIKNALAYTITYVILLSVLVFFSLFVLFFLSVGIAVVINKLSGIAYLGYFIVALFYFLLLILFLSQRKSIKAKIDIAISERTKNK